VSPKKSTVQQHCRGYTPFPYYPEQSRSTRTVTEPVALFTCTDADVVFDLFRRCRFFVQAHFVNRTSGDGVVPRRGEYDDAVTETPLTEAQSLPEKHGYPRRDEETTRARIVSATTQSAALALQSRFTCIAGDSRRVSRRSID